MIAQFSDKTLLLIYSLIILVTQFNAIFEAFKRKISDVSPPTTMRISFSFLLMSLVIQVVFRWSVFLFATLLINNIITILTASCLFIARLLMIYSSFNKDGYFKKISKKSEVFQKILLILETLFVLYFIVGYFILKL